MTEGTEGPALQQVEWPSWSHFLSFTDQLAEGISPQGGAFAFRGHADKTWKLEPSLTRIAKAAGLTKQSTLEIEETARQTFSAVAHLHLSATMLPAGANLPAWWGLMQHYGAPTRLLDWTHSPFVAAYFACESHSDRDGAVWAAHPATVNAFMEKRISFTQAIQSGAFGQDYPPRAVYLGPYLTRVTDRMLAQQMAFSVATETLADHGALMREAFGDPSQYPAHAVMFIKGIIPANRKVEFLFRLRAMNITAQSLFPGIDGLGRSVAELVRLSTHRAARHHPAMPPPPLETLTRAERDAQLAGFAPGWYQGVECRSCGMPILGERDDNLPSFNSVPGWGGRRDITCFACRTHYFYEDGTIPHLFRVERVRHGKIRWAIPPRDPNETPKIGCTCAGCRRCHTRQDGVKSTLPWLCQRFAITADERCEPCAAGSQEMKPPDT